MIKTQIKQHYKHVTLLQDLHFSHEGMDEFEDNDFDIEPPPDKEQEEQEEEEIKEQEIQDEETVNRKQKLKAALHYFIGKICEKEFNTGLHLSRRDNSKY